jgi:transcriptional regulator with XRE-family HTH domain
MPRRNARLKSLRERVPLTQAELAERVGVAELTVRRWEAGLRPQPAHVRRLCSVFDASPDELGYGLGDYPAPTEPALDALLEERPSVEDVQAAVHRLRSAYSSADPTDLHRGVRDRLTQVGHLLPAESTASRRRSLLEAAAWLAVLDGTVLADLRAREAAEDCVLTARRIAQRLGHSEIVAWTYETAAWMAVTDGQFPYALTLVEAGIGVAPRGGFGLVAALGQRARIHACLGEERGVIRDLREAERALAAVGDPPDPADHYFSGPGQAIYFGARAFARLGRPVETIEHAAEVVRLSQDPAQQQYCPTRALNARLEWAAALAKLGEEDATYAKALEDFDPIWWRPGTTQRTRSLLVSMRDPRLRTALAEQLRPLPSVEPRPATGISPVISSQSVIE